MCFPYGFAPYFACAKLLYTFPMVPAYSQAPWASKTTSKLQFTFCIFSAFTFLDYLLEPIWAMVTRPVQGPLSKLQSKSAPCQSKVVMLKKYWKGFGSEKCDLGNWAPPHPLPPTLILQKMLECSTKRRQKHEKTIPKWDETTTGTLQTHPVEIQTAWLRKIWFLMILGAPSVF